MSLHKLTAGDGYTYLTRQVAAHDATGRGRGTLGAYYGEKGEAPGVWMGTASTSSLGIGPKEFVDEAQMVALFGEGRHPNADAIERELIARGASSAEVDKASRLGAPFKIYDQVNMFRRRAAGAFRDYNTAQDLHPDTPVPAEVRARLRTALAATMFAEEFGRPHTDARELSGHLARISRQATTAVAGYDVTFSPVKSVSTLWAIAPREVAEIIEGAHRDAVQDTLSWLEDNAAFTRRGRNGVAQVEVRGLIAAAFTHRDSRAGDPDLHTHVAISNKVQTLDGQWLALDGRPLFKNVVAASERYNTRLEAILIDRLGVEFADRPGADSAKRAVREIVGVDGALPRQWSARRAAIDVRRAALSAKFQVDHGRPATPKEAVLLAQQATLETRQHKHEPRSFAEQRAAWRGEALAVLGGEVGLRDYLRGALESGAARRGARQVNDRWVRKSAQRALTTVSGTRAVWQENHIRAEAERITRSAGVCLADADRAVDAIVTAALSHDMSVPLTNTEPVVEPAVLRRSDGTSVYVAAGSQLFTSARVVAGEEAIVAMAGRRDGRTISAAAVDMALLESVANGVELNPGQAQLVRELATSGARVQLALAPAGTGKTISMRVLSGAWTASGGTVVGLAPSAAAAAVLREKIAADTDTLAKLIHALATGQSIPAWVTGIDEKTLVVIDEAGMAGTADLAYAVDYIVKKGGSVRLVGDDQQLAAIGAGGVLRDIADVHGAIALSQVMRFTDPASGAPNHAEGAASLALRDGDVAAVAYYLDHGRVHVGDQATVTDDAYTAWAADRAAGRDAIMLAPTRAVVAELNDRARRDRLAASPSPTGRQVTLPDQSHASAGDTIITRKNNRYLRISATDWVKNGDRWTVERVHDSGALDVVHLRTGRHLTLPADYVAQHVDLGYASTVHGAQGITADSCYTVAAGTETRQLLYVAMTRGRHTNHVYLTTAGDGDPHSVITRDALLPPTAGDILARVLARDGSPVSATSETRTLTDPLTRIAPAADQYYDALTTAAADHLGADAMTGIDTAAEQALPGITAAPAWPTLRAHLALLAVDGHDPATALRHAIADRELDTAADPAAVLDWRLHPAGQHSAHPGPLPWLPAVPAALATDPVWHTYLTARGGDVRVLGADITAQALNWTPTSAPRWATPLLDRDRALLADLAVWRAAHGVEDSDRRPTGHPLPAAADSRVQRALDRRVATAYANPKDAPARWAPLAVSIDPRITADPYWPVLADRLTATDRTGIDIAALTRAAGDQAPLPDEQPAAALWWRLSAHLSPAAMTATDHCGTESLRPSWTPVLADIVGPTAATRVLADPAWPALVAAVTHARRTNWEPAQLVETAYDLLRSGQPDDEPLRPDELATALVWRVAILTDTAPTTPNGDAATELAPATVTVQTATGGDLTAVAAADFVADDDWLASLIEPDEYDDPFEPLPDQLTAAPPIGGSSPHAGMPEAIWAGGSPVEPYLVAAPPRIELDADTITARARSAELNSQAAEFFAAAYTDPSWAPGYLAGRLGTDLAGDPRFTVGYAPDSWTALTDHLRQRGTSDKEIVAAGLGTVASTGRVIDRFRDRLMFAIKDGDDIHGWIARRNPARSDEDNAGPKYLNTPETVLFTKGHEMFGLTEAAGALDAGALPLLVEGPVDAIAITLVGEGNYIGVAPLGTAFSDTQADRLTPYLTPRGPGVIIATDADRAGQQAAHRAFWQLTARGANPQHLILDSAKDPAELFETRGAAAVRAALAHPTALADAVIAARIGELTSRLDTVEGRVLATRRAAEVIGALPPAEWNAHITALAAAIDVLPATAIAEVLAAGEAWTENAHELAKQRLTERLPAERAEPAAPISSPAAVSAARRWAPLADRIDYRLAADPHWTVLATHLDRAAALGVDLDLELPALAALSPLPDTHPARCLQYRLADARPGTLRPSTPQPARPGEPDDLTRPTTAEQITVNTHQLAAPQPAPRR